MSEWQGHFWATVERWKDRIWKFEIELQRRCQIHPLCFGARWESVLSLEISLQASYAVGDLCDDRELVSSGGFDKREQANLHKLNTAATWINKNFCISRICLVLQNLRLWHHRSHHFSCLWPVLIKYKGGRCRGGCWKKACSHSTPRHASVPDTGLFNGRAVNIVIGGHTYTVFDRDIYSVLHHQLMDCQRYQHKEYVLYFVLKYIGFSFPADQQVALSLIHTLTIYSRHRKNIHQLGGKHHGGEEVGHTRQIVQQIMDVSTPNSIFLKSM